MSRKWLVAGAVAVAVAIIGAGAVMAQTPTPGSGTGTTFLDRLAQKLGIDTPKLKDAVKSAHNDQIDEAVQNGDLTQQQADRLKNKLNEQTDEGNLGGPGAHGFGFRGGPKGFGFGFAPGFGLGEARDQVAQFLGISTDQLTTELQADGATLASVAQAHGKSRDDLKKFISDTAKAKTDEAVTNGDLTQKQADAINSKLNDAIDMIIDAPVGKFFHMFKGGMHMRGDDDNGDDTPAPDGSPQPQGGFGSSIFSS